MTVILMALYILSAGKLAQKRFVPISVLNTKMMMPISFLDF